VALKLTISGRMEPKNQGKKIFVLVLLLVYTLSLVSSVNVGISPGIIYFKDVVREGYAERYVVISADSDEKMEVSLTPRGDIASWLNYSTERIFVSKDEPYYLKLSVVPPVDTPNGNYSGFLRVMSETFSDSIEDHAVGKIRSSLDLAITVSVTDVEMKDCVVKNVLINSAEEGDPILLTMDILNKGNIRLNPKVLVDIWDQEQISILQSENFVGKSILPTVEDNFEFRIPSKDLDLGQYWSQISVLDCLQDFLLTFDVLEEGALKSSGVLLSILANKEVKKKETTPFEVNFKNVGEKEVVAQFKGRATYNGRIVQIFESEKMNVPIDTIEKFNFYFTPENSGKYVISGRVYYDGKQTFEGSTTIDVLGGGNYVPLIYGFFILLVGILFYKIRMEKKIYHQKLKRLK